MAKSSVGDFDFGGDIPPSFKNFDMEETSELAKKEPTQATAKETKEKGGESSISADISVISSKAIQMLNALNIPVTPANYAMFFQRALAQESKETKEAVIAVLGYESSSFEDCQKLEGRALQSLGLTRGILQYISNTYKSLTTLLEVIDKRSKEAMSVTNGNVFQNVANMFSEEISKIQISIKSQIQRLKRNYEDAEILLGSPENVSIYTQGTSFHSQKYFLALVEREIALMQSFNYHSSLLFVSLSKEILAQLTNPKALANVNRAIAKTLEKNIEFGEPIAYFGEKTFGVLVRFKQKQEAVDFTAQLIEKMSSSHIYIDDEEIPLKICAGIVELNPKQKAQELVKLAQNALSSAYVGQKDYVVGGK